MADWDTKKECKLESMLTDVARNRIHPGQTITEVIMMMKVITFHPEENMHQIL